MGNKKFLIILFLISLCIPSFAKEVTDTLESSKRDRVIVTYDITENNGKITVKFLDAKKKLGTIYRNKYKKLDEVIVLFFDRTGNYEDNMKFSGINTEAFMVPKEINYKISKDGYFFLNDNPALSMELEVDGNVELSIPIFLAHYEGKHRYEVFSRCENMVISLSKKKQAKALDKPIIQSVSQVVTTQEEADINLSEKEKEEVAKNLINSIEEGLGASDISYSVQKNAERLNELWPEIKDPDIKKQCENILRRYDLALNNKKDSDREKENSEREKEKEEEAQKLISYAQNILMKDDLSDYDLSDLRTTAQKLQMESSAVKDEALKLQMKQTTETCNERIVQIEKKKEQRNIWMIIGGVLLVILMFVGNQTFQHFRNAKSQKSLMEMQENVAKRAENEAKRRARSIAQSQIHKTQYEARKRTRNAIRDSISNISKKGKGNKEVSI